MRNKIEVDAALWFWEASGWAGSNGLTLPNCPKNVSDSARSPHTHRKHHQPPEVGRKLRTESGGLTEWTAKYDLK